MAVTKQYAFLSPAPHAWNIWTSEGHKTMTNPGASHRVYESLVFCIDALAKEGYEVEHICVEQGEPKLVMLSKQTGAATTAAASTQESEQAQTSQPAQPSMASSRFRYP